jgi:hypothetical protein
MKERAAESSPLLPPGEALTAADELQPSVWRWWVLAVVTLANFINSECDQSRL